MNILYISFIDIKNDLFIGVKKKMEGQIKAFSKLGNNVSYIVYEENNLVVYNKDCKKRNLSRFKNKIDEKINLYKEIINIIKEQNIELIYIRYPVAWFGLVRLLRKIDLPQLKIYLEIPTYPYDKELSKLLKIKDKITRIVMKNYIDKIVISSDKLEYLFDIPCIYIDNCVDVENIKLKENNLDYNEDIIRLIGVSYIRNTVGYDRIINGINEYYKNDNKLIVELVIVGNGDLDELEKLKALIDKYKLNKYIKMVGCKSGKELDDLFDISHIAVGSLGDHRLGVFSKSPLKSREYCARGIPFISSVQDPGFSDKEDFILNVSCDDSNIDINKVIEFYENIKIKDNLSNTIRTYAKEHFDWYLEYRKLFRT